MRKLQFLFMSVLLLTTNSWGQDAKKKGVFSIGIDYVHVLRPYEWRAAEYQFLFADKLNGFTLPAIYGQYTHVNGFSVQLKAHAFTQVVRLNSRPIADAKDPSFYYEGFPLSRRAVYVDLMVGYNVLKFWKGSAINDKWMVNVMGGLRNYFMEPE